jgi:hypothetical protein
LQLEKENEGLIMEILKNVWIRIYWICWFTRFFR